VDRIIEEIAVLADAQIQKGMTIWQKWTCPNCDSRQTMDTPNVLYRSGRCQECGQVNIITVCGFMLAGGALVEDLAKSIKDA
jgi:hypothetical protein